jgi:polyphosphate kinase
METITSPTSADPSTQTPSLYFNRDKSWLDFNRRVLHEAEDTRTPLLERVKFLAIYSSNSDEFFMKRIGLIKRKLAAGATDRTLDGLTWAQQFTISRNCILESSNAAIKLWTDVLRPELEAHNIYIRDYEQLTKDQQHAADEYFRNQIFPVLTPLAVDPGHPFPFISNLSVSIGVLLRQPNQRNNLFARIKVPQLFSRWFTFITPDEAIFVPIESLIEARLDALFPGMEIIEHQHFRVTRNAEGETDIEDPEDLLEVVQEELRARRFADTVRVQTAHAMSREMRQYLIDGLEVQEQDIYDIPEPLGKVDLMAIANLDRPELKAKPWTPQTAPRLADPEADMFALIRRGDILVHHPYESFDSSVERFILTAAKDPKVLAIKMTLYRTSGDSPFVAALASAAESGKQVAVLVELKARFDEERNIQWAQTLESAGAHVVYGVLGLKTHTKTALVVRREDDRVRCYCHIATGNYNSKTAQLYTDLGLFTAREDICEDVVDLFAFLTGRSLKRTYSKLLVAPVTMRRRFLEMIDRETANAGEGKPARIIAKMNALEDSEIIGRLYKASQAGVQINLIVRGFCCLRASVPGLSDNIRVISVIGRFLEHSRIFCFYNNGDPEYYMGSGDWMSRNLSGRVEAAVPVEDPTLRKRVAEILEILLADNRQAWDLAPDGTWTQRQAAPGQQEIATHQRLMDIATQATASATLARLTKASGNGVKPAEMPLPN